MLSSSPSSVMSGDALPSFASPALFSLDSTVKAKAALLQSVREELADNEERIKLLRGHLSNVTSESEQISSLLTEHSRSSTSASHLSKLLHNEFERVTREAKEHRERIAKDTDALNTLSNARYSAKAKLDAFQVSLNWNREELVQWALAAKQKEEDQRALARYALEDNHKIKALTLKIEQLARTDREKQQELNNALTHTQSVQIELDKTAAEYRLEYAEKARLVDQWNTAKGSMFKTDRSINDISERILANKGALKEMKIKNDDSARFLSLEKDNSKQVQTRIEAEERANDKKRIALQNEKTELIAYEDQVQNMRNQMEKADSQLRECVGALQLTQANKEKKARQLEEIKAQTAAAQSTLALEKENKTSLAQRTADIDALYKAEQTGVSSLTAEMERLKDAQFKTSQKLFQARSAEATLIAEISGAQGKNKNSKAKIMRFDSDSLKQQEMLYNIEFQVQQLERKLSEVQGKRSIEENEALQKEIAELTATLTQAEKSNALLISQVKRIEDDLRAAKRTAHTVEEQKKEITQMNDGIEMENESIDREIRRTKNSSDTNLVQHDQMKLEVKKLRDTLHQRSNDIIALEHRKHALQQSMAEREKEIELHTQVQRAQLRNGEESKHTLLLELKERQIKVDKLKLKYAATSKDSLSMNSTNGKGGSEEDHSQAYYIISAAQEREELQRVGDALNTQIKTCEQEIYALQNTHTLLQQRNSKYRESFNRLSEDSEEVQVRASLEEQQRAGIAALYTKRNMLRDCMEEFEAKKGELSHLLSNTQELASSLRHRENDCATLRKQVQEQIEALKRSERMKNSAFKKYRSALPSVSAQDNAAISEDAMEADIAVQPTHFIHIRTQEKKRRNRIITEILRDWIRNNPNNQEAHQLISMLTQANIAIAQDTTQNILEEERPQSAASSVDSAISIASSQSGAPPSSRHSSYDEKERASAVGSGGLPSVKSVRTAVHAGRTPVSSRSRPSSRPSSSSSHTSNTAQTKNNKNTQPASIQLGIDARKK